MIRRIIAIAFILGLAVSYVPVSAAEITVLLEGTPIEFDVPPQIIEARTMVPMRAILEALGAEVIWLPETPQDIIAHTPDGNTIRMSVGSPIIHINDRNEVMDVAPQLVYDRTLVPARFVAQAMDLYVGWVATSQTVVIGEWSSWFTNTRYLELINHNHRFGAEPNRDLIVSAWPTVAVRATDVTLHSTALEAVSEMFGAAVEDGTTTLFVSSGYRNYYEQAEVYHSGIDRDMVLPPGYSEHHSGLGIDILALGVPQLEMADAPEGRWLAENSWRFGIILRYPEGREDITGIAHEHWHFRYVGQPHAWFMHYNDMVLEEYIQFLRETGGFAAAFEGREYLVRYQIPTSGRLHIPANINSVVSGDNAGGYIITSWE